MINLISTQADPALVGGPAKVFRNLARGLDLIGYPYVVNRALDSTPRLWIHDDLVALRYAARSGAKAVVGPNLYVLPGDVPADVDLRGALYVQPSAWVADLWRTAGFTRCDLAVWPVGIDLDEFRPRNASTVRREALIYHKLRPEDELQRIIASLDAASLPHRLIRYGSYAERDYVAALEGAALVVWHGRHESQGIALEEAMAMDVPILVCDVTRLSQEAGSSFPSSLDAVPVTAAPYFDATCGVRTYDLDDVGALALRMLDERASFSPRAFVEENLSLQGQARRFVELWEHFGLTFDEGLGEKQTSDRPWRPPLDYRTRQLAARVRRKVRI
jgi:hypothetical protein